MAGDVGCDAARMALVLDGRMFGTGAISSGAVCAVRGEGGIVLRSGAMLTVKCRLLVMIPWGLQGCWLSSFV